MNRPKLATVRVPGSIRELATKGSSIIRGSSVGVRITGRSIGRNEQIARAGVLCIRFVEEPAALVARDVALIAAIGRVDGRGLVYTAGHGPVFDWGAVDCGDEVVGLAHCVDGGCGCDG